MNTKGRALKILVLSDSHGHLDDRILAHAAEADEAKVREADRFRPKAKKK